MFSKFVCQELGDQMQIQDYKLPDGDGSVRYPALINNNQFVVMQMSSVENSVDNHLDMMTLCSGSLETEVLPLLTSSIFATEVCVKFYIEKIGQQVVYRSRECSLVLPNNDMYKKCQSCRVLKENLCANFNKEDISERTMKEELNFDSYDHDDNDFLSDSEQEMKVKLEQDYKPTVISISKDSALEEDNKSEKLSCHDREKRKGKHKEKIISWKILEKEIGIKNLNLEKEMNEKKKARPWYKTMNYEGKFKCPYCENDYSSKGNIGRHIRDNHKEEYARIKAKKRSLTKHEGCIKCPFCDASFIKYINGVNKGDYKLWQHILSLHEEYAEDFAIRSKKQYFNCPAEECKLIFFIHKNLQKHAEEHHSIIVPPLNPGIEIDCPFCDEKFKNESRIVSHVETHHCTEKDNPIYAEFLARYQIMCQECGKVMNNPWAFQQHMKLHHPLLYPDIAKEKKKEPKTKYKTNNRWKNRKVEEEGECLCVECGQTLQSLTKLKKHVKTFHVKKTVSCPECFKLFTDNSKLSRHVKLFHLNERNYECDKCEKKFIDNSKLQQHVTAVHDKLKPYLCDLCPYECAKASNLNIHRKKTHGVTENTSKGKLIAQVKSGEHPYYNEEKFQLLLAAH